MSLKKYKATTPGRRNAVRVSRKGLHKGGPIKRLSAPKKKNAGRNSQGRITVRHKGGGVKQRHRKIDFRRDKKDIFAKVERLEYDPNRSAFIALLVYEDGERRYIVAPQGLKEGDRVISGDEVEIEVGNAMPIGQIPSGVRVHNVEMMPGAGGKLARAAGQSVLVRGSTGKGYAIVKLTSGEIRKINEKCMATIGEVSNPDHFNERLGKAGVKRRKGIRPTVRGVAMHAGDHPQGGGEARNGIHIAKDVYGNRIGKKTRKNKKTERFIIKHRVAKRRKP
jgi:large subunit ribosomal protein L2